MRSADFVGAKDFVLVDCADSGFRHQLFSFETHHIVSPFSGLLFCNLTTIDPKL